MSRVSERAYVSVLDRECICFYIPAGLLWSLFELKGERRNADNLTRTDIFEVWGLLMCSEVYDFLSQSLEVGPLLILAGPKIQWASSWA